MEANDTTAFGSWLKFLCPTCLTDEDRTASSVRGRAEKPKFGSWLKFLCPTCLTDEDSTALSARGRDEKPN